MAIHELLAICQWQAPVLVLNFQIGELFAATPAEITFTFQSMLYNVHCFADGKMATFMTFDPSAIGQTKL